MKFIKAAATLVLICLCAQAHDLYLRPNTFQPKPGETIRVEYHNGDSFPNSEVPAPIERLRDMQVLSGGVATPFTNLRVEGKAAVADARAPRQSGHFLLISRTVPNFIELEPAEFEDYLKHEGLGSIVAWRKQHGESGKAGREIYSKYVKALGLAGRANDAFGVVAGLTIEFVPLANPYGIAPGALLPVRVLLRGKPAPGLAIEASNFSAGKVSETTVGRTDANGEIQIPIGNPGLWRLHTIHMERRADRSAADWESFWASLTFEIDTVSR